MDRTELITEQVLESLENIKFKNIILLHGEGFVAWCWYKTVAQLEEVGLQPTALDLTGYGIDLTDTNTVTTLEEYSKPLIKYLENLPEHEKVILVGHSTGGACLSYALEHFLEKISKAIFLCATMVSNGQKDLSTCLPKRCVYHARLPIVVHKLHYMVFLESLDFC